VKKIVVTDEILNKIHTDSDIYELADEMGVSCRDLDYAISNKLIEGTPCHNCKYVALARRTYPCTECSRAIHTQDFYQEVEFKE